MKKFAFAIGLFFASAIGMAQAPIYVYVDTEIDNGDTLRTFYVEDNYCARLIDQWTADYGTPEGAGSGNLTWDNVNIPGVGNNLKIVANDGARIFDGQNWSHSTFLNGADMMTKLSADPARARRMYITIKKGNKNKVTTEAAANSFITMAEAIMLAP